MKTRSIILLPIVFSLLVLGGCIQRDRYEPLPPDPPPPSGYQYQFVEEFDNDTKGWAFNSDSAYALVEDGEYVMVDDSYLGELNIAAIPTGCNVDGDFLVKTAIETDYAMAVIFGAGVDDYGFSFIINSYYGDFAVYYEGNATEGAQTLIDWTTSSSIKEFGAGYNDIEIEQINDRWYFYINGTQVATLPAEYLAGDEFGFMVLDRTVGYADYLEVNW